MTETQIDRQTDREKGGGGEKKNEKKKKKKPVPTIVIVFFFPPLLSLIPLMKSGQAEACSHRQQFQRTICGSHVRPRGERERMRERGARIEV